MEIKIPSCSHTFDLQGLESIIKHGLTPGSTVGERSWILGAKSTQGIHPAVMYTSTFKLKEHGARLSCSGHIVAEQTIPFVKDKMFVRPSDHDVVADIGVCRKVDFQFSVT